jgi:hypothetical protein
MERNDKKWIKVNGDFINKDSICKIVDYGGGFLVKLANGDTFKVGYNDELYDEIFEELMLGGVL